MDKWEYKVLRGLSEDELNKWGEEGYEVYLVIPPAPPPPGTFYNAEYTDTLTKVILKRRKP
jgi:hypothetical protein